MMVVLADSCVLL